MPAKSALRRQYAIALRNGLLLAALAVVMLASAVRFIDRWQFMVDQRPADFDVNWVAAHRLEHRLPLYDAGASREEGVRRIGPALAPDFSAGGTYSTYIGTPATALFYAPFVPFSHDEAARLYRLTQGGLMVAAVVITGFGLPRRSRLYGWAIGAVALMIFWPVQQSIGLGQVDGFVTCSIAIGVWGAARRRWRIAGAALGVATLLKVSPGLLLIYLALRGFRKVIIPALVTAACLLAVAMVVGRPADLATWLTDVAPRLSRGGLHVNNQSLAAWFARLTGHDLGWLSLETGLGAWRVVAPLVVLLGLGALYVMRRHQRFVLLELGGVILVALLAGPISWDNYSTWAIIAVMLVADRSLWAGRRAIEIGCLFVVLLGATALMHKGTQYPTPDLIQSDWWRRVDSGGKTIALLGYLGVALWLLGHQSNARALRLWARPHRRGDDDAIDAVVQSNSQIERPTRRRT